MPHLQPLLLELSDPIELSTLTPSRSLISEAITVLCSKGTNKWVKMLRKGEGKARNII